MNKNIDFPGLKISDIKFYRFDIPLREEFKLAAMSLNVAHNVLVKIETNVGIIGWGEGAPFHALVGETQDIALAAGKEFKPYLLGRNPLAIDAIVRFMDKHLPHNTTLKSAIDMALYDVASKAAEMPLYLFLGGEKREIETDMTIGLCEPEEAGEKALSIKEMGFNIIKVKLGLDDAADYARLKYISDAVGKDVILRIDANQGWDRMRAIRNLKAYDEFNIEFCEQPCPVNDINGTKLVSSQSTIPIMADESLFSPTNAISLITNNVAPYFNIKFSKSGGIKNAIKIASIADAGAIPSMVGCMSETRLGLTAAAHFGLSNPIIQFFDLDSHLEHSIDPIEGGISIENGMITLPDSPGIGAEPDESFIQSCEVNVLC
ncbi:mandelate racemase/muconate lactonizing enzyme family protein [Portibacter lacus]|uniref:Dipeptide epimerase n=1 Tax=Portibacter lacus TaxID=1099794 RepID=A0AA37SVE0_9BACT|nr:dipeptide epimerase [Portibacter lacus]GLR19975.1 dipeptide epimerase [Portibacter lacus]